MNTFGNETRDDNYYEPLPGPSSRNHHSASNEKRDGLTKEQSPVEGKTKIECRGNSPARRGKPNDYYTELRVALPNRKSTLRSKTENDY